MAAVQALQVAAHGVHRDSQHQRDLLVRLSLRGQLQDLQLPARATQGRHRIAYGLGEGDGLTPGEGSGLGLGLPAGFGDAGCGAGRAGAGESAGGDSCAGAASGVLCSSRVIVREATRSWYWASTPSTSLSASSRDVLEASMCASSAFIAATIRLTSGGTSAGSLEPMLYWIASATA